MSLSTLGLSPDILKALTDKGYTQATPIQKALIPTILSGQDTIASASTGTGKTAAYMLPLIHAASQTQTQKHYPKILVIVPTKELAKQVHNNTKKYSKYTELISVAIYGGTEMKPQTNRLNDGADIIIATPGRLIEHIKQKNISLNGIEWLVLDEADTILDMSFLREVEHIISLTPPSRQSILISATLTPALKTLSQSILSKPALIEINSMGSTASAIEQIAYPVTVEKKDELLSYLIGSKNYKKVLLFVRKKELADSISDELNKSGLNSLAIHGDKSTGARARALDKFDSSQIRVLVSTDIAARGLDIPNIDAIFNYDIPHVQSDYIHRIGRTARAGKSGIAITLVSPPELIALHDLERLLGKEIPKIYLAEYAPPKQESNQTKKRAKDKKKTQGAFGNKKIKKPTTKKRKTTKRDGWKR